MIICLETVTDRRLSLEWPKCWDSGTAAAGTAAAAADKAIQTVLEPDEAFSGRHSHPGM
jgi:hypothetical protein